MTRRKIAAFVMSTGAFLAASSANAQSGIPAFDECVIACISAGGGQQGDGTFCKIICARELDKGNGNRESPGPKPNEQPRMPGCRTADKRCAPNFPIPDRP